MLLLLNGGIVTHDRLTLKNYKVLTHYLSSPILMILHRTRKKILGPEGVIQNDEGKQS